MVCDDTVYDTTIGSPCSSTSQCVATNFTVISWGDFVFDLWSSLEMDFWESTVSVLNLDTGNVVPATLNFCCAPFSRS